MTDLSGTQISQEEGSRATQREKSANVDECIPNNCVFGRRECDGSRRNLRISFYAFRLGEITSGTKAAT